MVFSQMVNNQLMLRYEDEDYITYPNLNNFMTNDEIYEAGQILASLQEKDIKSINKLSKYIIM